MERRYFQVKMNPRAHAQLKLRAKQLEISIGELTENLISAMEIRLQRAYKTIGIQEGLLDETLLRIILKEILTINEAELREKLDKASRTTNTTTTLYKPEITV